MTPPESNDNIATDSTKKPDDNVTIILPEIISEIDNQLHGMINELEG